MRSLKKYPETSDYADVVARLVPSVSEGLTLRVIPSPSLRVILTLSDSERGRILLRVNSARNLN